jgi:hypothetical protein
MTSPTPYKPHRHPRNTGKIFLDLNDDEDVMGSQFHFLQDIWDFSYGNSGDHTYAFLGFKDAVTGKWFEEVVPESAISSYPEMKELLSRYPRWSYDQYFCPNSFSKPRRKSEFALPTRFGWCDMDESDPEDYDPWPSLVWETSPDRYQGLWSWDQTHTPDEAEAYSKALAYRHGGDRNGWSCTKMLRLIGSVNHKPQYDEPIVRTVYCDWSRIEARPVPLPSRRRSPSTLPDVDVDPTRFDRLDVIKRYRDKLHPKAVALMRNRKVYEPNRSARIFFMIRALHEAGASFDEIACVIWTSPYFVEKHGQRLDKLNEEISRVTSRAEAMK